MNILLSPRETFEGQILSSAPCVASSSDTNSHTAHGLWWLLASLLPPQLHHYFSTGLYCVPPSAGVASPIAHASVIRAYVIYNIINTITAIFTTATSVQSAYEISSSVNIMSSLLFDMVFWYIHLLVHGVSLKP